MKWNFFYCFHSPVKFHSYLNSLPFKNKGFATKLCDGNLKIHVLRQQLMTLCTIAQVLHLLWVMEPRQRALLTKMSTLTFLTTHIKTSHTCICNQSYALLTNHQQSTKSLIKYTIYLSSTTSHTLINFITQSIVPISFTGCILHKLHLSKLYYNAIAIS